MHRQEDRKRDKERDKSVGLQDQSIHAPWKRKKIRFFQVPSLLSFFGKNDVHTGLQRTQ